MIGFERQSVLNKYAPCPQFMVASVAPLSSSAVMAMRLQLGDVGVRTIDSIRIAANSHCLQRV